MTTLAAKFFPGSDQLQSELTRAGLRWGNFRKMAEAVSMARHFAADGPLELAYLRAAIQVVGGKA